VVVSRVGKYNIEYCLNRQQGILRTWVGGMVLVSLFWGSGMLFLGVSPVAMAWLIFFVGVILIILQPRYGLYLILFFSLLGDSFLMPWYPFVKNFSSSESIFYVQDTLIFSPAEAYLVLVLLSWGLRLWPVRRLPCHGGALGLPFGMFSLSLAVGIGYGIFRGGNLNIALWEVRPIFYFPLVYLLTVNLITERVHISTLVWSVILALGLKGLIGVHYFLIVRGGDLGGLEAITDHAAAVHMNSLFVMALNFWIFRGTSSIKKLGLLVLLPGVALTYLATQRRAAFVGLALAFGLIAIVLYRENRRLFWTLVPPLTILALLYLGAFWNNSGLLGMPARGIRSVFFAEQNSKDYTSNMARVVENINTNFTIHRAPLGVGFGNPFLIVATMPDISFFIWWQYITHNSVLWIWMQTGVIGFFSLMFLIESIILLGIRVSGTVSDGELKAIALTWLLYVIMHFVYAYVDMSWDSQSMLYLGSAAGGLSVLMEAPFARSNQKIDQKKLLKKTPYWELRKSYE